MKFKIGGNQHIEFATDVVGLSDFAPVKKASYYLPKWFGEMKESRGNYSIIMSAARDFGSGTVTKTFTILLR